MVAAMCAGWEKVHGPDKAVLLKTLIAIRAGPPSYTPGEDGVSPEQALRSPKFPPRPLGRIHPFAAHRQEGLLR